MSFTREITIGNREIKLEFQKYAKQANSAVMVTCGDTQILVTVCAEKEAKPGTDFFPLGVDYIEKSYAAGRIPGGFRKREGRPGDKETLIARVIDRPLRPCFPEGYRNETVITCIVVSYDEKTSTAPLCVLGASAALMASDIPFDGPVAALHVGMKDGDYVLDPIAEGEENLELDLNLACKEDAVLMVEAGANFLSEEKMLEAINYSHNLMQPLIELQKEIRKEIGKEKMQPKQVGIIDPELFSKVEAAAKDKLIDAMGIANKQERSKTVSQICADMKTELNTEGTDSMAGAIGDCLKKIQSNHMRSMILDDKKRIDGRAPNDVRQITCEIGNLKRAHGSSLFTRGETQALASVTLGAAEDMQRTDSLDSGDLKERFFLHYNFPPFSVGEARMMRNPGRREIGHGALAQRALEPIIPDFHEFGYTMRVVSEVLESNGSSSMATVCSGSMALLDAGVPIKAPIAGIAMGLVKEGEKYTVLSDILGDEDHLGDMDFKVCGNSEGITALQMDIKIGGITQEIMGEALSQAKEGRLHILGKMAEATTKPGELADNAPRIFKLKVGNDKIRDLIGPGGKNIKRITADTGVKIDIDDNGIISIVAPDATSAEAAKSMIRSSTTNPEVGEVYLGKVVRVVDFGAFIELRPGMEGLCHISQLDEARVKKVEDILKNGDEVMVKILDIDRQGRIKLSRKDAIGQKPTN